MQSLKIISQDRIIQDQECRQDTQNEAIRRLGIQNEEILIQTEEIRIQHEEILEEMRLLRSSIEEFMADAREKKKNLNFIRLRRLIYHGRRICVQEVDPTKDESYFFDLLHEGRLNIPADWRDLLLNRHVMGNRIANETAAYEEVYNLAHVVCSLSPSQS